MPTWVSIRNNRGAWDGVNVDALIRAFTTYGPILEMEVFDRGYRASMLFSNHADALAFVEEMTFSPMGLYLSLTCPMDNAWGHGSPTKFKCFFSSEMPTWVSIHNNRGAWDGVNVARLK